MLVILKTYRYATTSKPFLRTKNTTLSESERRIVKLKLEIKGIKKI